MNSLRRPAQPTAAIATRPRPVDRPGRGPDPRGNPFLARSGVVKMTVTPTRIGMLTITAPNLTLCPRRLAIAPTNGGTHLTG